MRKYPPDVSESDTCINANLKMVERRDPDNFPRFPPREKCALTIPKIALKRVWRKANFLNSKTYVVGTQKNRLN